MRRRCLPHKNENGKRKKRNERPNIPLPSYSSSLCWWPPSFRRVRNYSEEFGAVPNFLEGRIGVVVSGDGALGKVVTRSTRWRSSPPLFFD